MRGETLFFYREKLLPDELAVDSDFGRRDIGLIMITKLLAEEPEVKETLRVTAGEKPMLVERNNEWEYYQEGFPQMEGGAFPSKIFFKGSQQGLAELRSLIRDHKDRNKPGTLVIVVNHYNLKVYTSGMVNRPEHELSELFVTESPDKIMDNSYVAHLAARLSSGMPAEEMFFDLVNKVPAVFSQYLKDAQVTQGITLGAHTFMVVEQFNKYFSSFMDEETRKNFYLLLALHDIGKPDDGTSDEQHPKTIKFIKTHVQKSMNLSDVQLNWLFSFIDGDPLGAYMKDIESKLFDLKSVNMSQRVAEILRMSTGSGLSLAEFFRLLTIFYQSDSSSYTSDVSGSRAFDNVYLRGDDGKLVYDRQLGRLIFSKEREAMFRLLEKKIANISASQVSGKKQMEQNVDSLAGDWAGLPVVEHLHIDPKGAHEGGMGIVDGKISYIKFREFDSKAAVQLTDDRLRMERLVWEIFNTMMNVNEMKLVRIEVDINGQKQWRLAMASEYIPNASVTAEDIKQDADWLARVFVLSALVQDFDRTTNNFLRVGRENEGFTNKIAPHDFGAAWPYREDRVFSVDNFFDMLKGKGWNNGSIFNSLEGGSKVRAIRFVAEALQENTLRKLINAVKFHDQALKNTILSVYIGSLRRLRVTAGLKNESTDSSQQQQIEAPGGIDLNPVDRILETGGSAKTFRFHVEPAQLKEFLSAPGFSPVIIGIQANASVPEFLGIP